MINLFLIVHNFSGAKTYLDELSRYLVGKKDICLFQLHLNYIALKEFSIQKNDKITSVYIPEKITKDYDVRYYKRAAQLVFYHFQNLTNVVFHANMPEQFLFAKQVKELFQCPIVFTFHFLLSFYTFYDKITGSDYSEIEKGNVLEKYMLESADHIICVTRFTQRAILNIYKISSLNTSVIYNGKALSKGTLINPKNLKVSYGFSANDRLILYAGQLEPRKGIDNLIRAFLMIARKLESVRLIIAGSGEYNNYLPLAQECIGRISFTGKLDKKSLYDFYQFSEIGVIPSQYEQCSYVAIEMMQFGLPIIISDVPGLNELIIHKKSGLVCKTEIHRSLPNSIEVNEKELAKQIEYLLKSKTGRSNYATAAYSQVLKRHSLVKMGAKTLKIYQQLVKIK